MAEDKVDEIYVVKSRVQNHIARNMMVQGGGVNAAGTPYIRLHNKKRLHLGLFDSAYEAAKAFDKAAKEMYGEFCGKLNF